MLSIPLLLYFHNRDYVINLICMILSVRIPISQIRAIIPALAPLALEDLLAESNVRLLGILFRHAFEGLPAVPLSTAHLFST